MNEETDSSGKTTNNSSNRLAWDSRVQYLFMVIAYSVGLSNIWRFPYLTQRHGRGAFLIPYLIMLIIEGMPLLYLELAIGQRMRKSCVAVWNQLNPFLGGLGMASVFCTFIISIYFNFVTTWIYFYIFHSFQSSLPWSTCPTSITNNQTVVEPECEISGAASYFWYRKTLNISPGIDDPGGMRLKLLACHLGSWAVLYLCVSKGIKSSGKVAYITTLLPLLVIIIFFIKGMTMRGAIEGIKYMFTPELSDILDIQTWLDASSQTFFSLGMGFGGLITFASYNPINNNVHKDTLLVSATNFVMATFATMVTFSIIGFKATVMYEKCIDHNIGLLNEVCSMQNLTSKVCKGYNTSEGLSRETFELSFLDKISELQNMTSQDQVFKYCSIQEDLNKGVEGTGLIFIVYAQAIVEFGPSAPFWSLVFFILLLSMGMGSMFGNIECISTFICDLEIHPWLEKKWVAAGIVCSLACSIGLVFVQGSGFYWLELFDSFLGTYPLILVGLVESVAVGWILGTERFSDDIQFMIGYRPSVIWKLAWKIITPIALAILLVGSLISKFSEPITYRVYDRTTTQMQDMTYPWYALLICALLVLSSLLWLPGVALARKLGLLRYKSKHTSTAVPHGDRDANL
ncbi:hypothetical protein RRG08_015885 [Elysia crispata]|uniref:Transporter n=1 Tax=Elysia crispata TaxID=231223 RepID=A0AAE1AM33_9GAST|nr:hypothetical protein RRG08_015885 [Elysia crispata]